MRWEMALTRLSKFHLFAQTQSPQNECIIRFGWTLFFFIGLKSVIAIDV